MKTALVDSLNHQDSELFVVEGPAAANALLSLRERNTQAILPMQGKIPNAVKSSQTKLEQHLQIADLLQSLHPKRQVELEFKRFRYQRVVLLNDPDIDGMHAGMLLILFLYRYLPQLITQSRLYMVQVPLYGLYQDGVCISKAYSNDELNTQQKTLEGSGAPIDVRRFKSVASVDREILLQCLASNNDKRRQLSMSECTRLCQPFEK